MKALKLNQFNQKNYSAGFTLIELLVSISIMGIVFTLVGTGITFMVSSDQKLAAAQSRRVEVSNALDVISYDIRKSERAAISESEATPTLLDGFTPVLFLKISIVCDDSSTMNERVIYSTKAKIDGDGRVGPNVLYRYGRIANELDAIPCSGSSVVNQPRNVAIADNIISAPTATQPTCSSPSATTPAATSAGAKGFFTCISDNQVSIALFAKLNDPLIYGDNRTITSGSITSTATATGGILSTSTDLATCTVPDLLTTPKTPSEANMTIQTEVPTQVPPYTGLSYAGIGTNGGSNVVSQAPSAGSKIPCKTGLVTYTY